MKNVFIHKRTLSLVLIITIFLSCFSISVMAADISTENKIDPILESILNEASDDEMIPVSIWFKDIDKAELVADTIEDVNVMINENELPSESVDIIDRNTSIINMSQSEIELTLEEVQSIIEIKRNNAKSVYREYNNNQLQACFDNVYEYNLIYNCKFAPNIIVETSKSKIYDLVDCMHVISLNYYDEDVFSVEADINEYANGDATDSTIDTADLLVAINSNSGLTGDGVKIGVIEGTLPDKRKRALTNINNAIVYDPNLTSRPYGDHTSSVASLLVGKCEEEGYKYLGMVPDATLYCTTINTPGGWKEGIEWLIESGVNVINISYSLVDERYTGVNDVSKWIDHVSYQHSVTIVAASGYFTTSQGAYNVSPLAFSNNIIVVGAVNLEFDINNNYVFTEYNNSAYASNGKYYPHVVAPGNPGYIPGCNDGNTGDGQMSGNSFSTPLVVGAAAQLIDAQPSLATNPTLIKSLIMAGANGKKSGTSTDTSGTDMDRKYGAGVVNVLRSSLCMSTSTLPKTFTYQYAPISTTLTLEMRISQPGNIRMALNWQYKSMFGDDEHINTEDLITYSHSFMFITVTSPKGNVYTSRDTSGTCQLLVFDVPSNDLGDYTVTISRNGPSSYSTPISLACYGIDYMTQIS